MTKQISAEKDSDCKNFIRKHWGVVAIFVVAAALIVVGAVYVCWWFSGNAQTTGLVPSTLNLWTMDNVVMFILNLIFWELVIIGIPVAVGAVLGWQWWKRLPAEERDGYFFGRRSQSRNVGGAISTLLFIAFAVKVYVDGKWNVAISTYTVNYVVDSMITILVWMAAILAIPATIVILWWIHHEITKPQLKDEKGK